jgi:nitrate reductase assembly molybdenum cofactor insertion protein NarJ
MNSAEPIAPGIRDLLAEAAAWRLLGLLLERPREGWWREAEELSRDLCDPALAAAVDAANEEATEGLYLAILGPGGIVSPREVSYHGMEDPGHILADLRAFYEAFAFNPRSEEAPDHLAVEAGFLGYLCLKEAFARTQGQDEQAAIAADAASRFRKDHLCTCAQFFAERVEETGVRYLTLAARALARLAGPPESSPADACLPLVDEGCLPPCSHDGDGPA